MNSNDLLLQRLHTLIAERQRLRAELLRLYDERPAGWHTQFDRMTTMAENVKDQIVRLVEELSILGLLPIPANEVTR